MVGNVEIPSHSIATIPIKRTGTCIASTPCVYKVQANKILKTQNPQLVMLPTVHLKNDIEQDHFPFKCITFLNDPVHLTKYTLIWSLHLYNEYQDKQNTSGIEVNQIITVTEMKYCLVSHMILNLQSFPSIVVIPDNKSYATLNGPSVY